MFARDAEPIANVPVYKRIGIGAPDPQPAGLTVEYRSTAEICADLARQSENARIWRAIVDTASGVNPPAPVEYEAPSEDCA